MNFKLFCLFFLSLFAISKIVFGQQQDVEFHLKAHLFNGQKILKVKRDFHDPYAWVLAENNKIYRVNSVDLSIIDFTSVFAPYSAQGFNDIVGRSGDTVFVSTNSPKVIEYLKGAIHVIGASDGIPGPVNSLGMNLGFGAVVYRDRGFILIATENGLRTFDPIDQTIGTLFDDIPAATDSPHANTKIYQSTYRTEVHKDSIGSSTSPWANETIKYSPTAFNAPDNGALVGEYVWLGKNYGTQVNTVDLIMPAEGTSYSFVFANFFWGTEKGLFKIGTNYSFHDVYQKAGRYLDGIKVNKITNMMGLTSFNRNYISGFVKQNLLVGTDNGLYFSTSIYGSKIERPFKFLHFDEIGNKVINDVCVNAVANPPYICEDGVWVAANDGLYYIKPDYGKFLNPIQQSLASFQDMPANVSEVELCANTSIIAKVDQGFTNIQWYYNGAFILDGTDQTLQINEPGEYKVVIYDSCDGLHVESNVLKVTGVADPVFTFNYPQNLTYCAGTSLTLKATGSSNYQYRWYRNGVLTTNTGANLNVTANGKYKVEVSSCGTSWLASNEVNVNFINLPKPVISSAKTTYCKGTAARLKSSVAPSAGYNLQWYRNAQAMPQFNDRQSIDVDEDGSYSIKLVSSQANSNGTNCEEIANAFAINFVEPPAVSIAQAVTGTLCQGQIVRLKAVHNGGVVKWSTGENTDEISVTRSGNYKATVTTNGDCSAEASYEVNYFDNPVLHIADTSICIFKREPVLLKAPGGFANYVWNNVAGQQTFSVTAPGIVTLTVTDYNGCTATQQIQVSEQCPDIYVPNTFTPNGDGINDIWNIQGLDEGSVVNVYNRSGRVIYQSKGYSIPWNATYNGQLLPAGVYYYVINVKSGTKKLSGYVTVLR